MNVEQQELFRRLQEFSPDDPAAAFPFSRRLAKENGWSRAYALRVIEEYKRFAFLAMTAGHIASPSDAVDQAWHLHLTYTRSYWDDFCPNLLRRPLHHEPTRGGLAEREKHDRLYSMTLASYKRLFGHAPPDDIWPVPVHSPSRPKWHTRIDRSEYWFLPKARLPRRAVTAALALIAVVVVGCNGALIDEVGKVLDMKGQDFLAFFAVVGGGAALAAFVLRYLLRGPGDSGRDPDPPLDPYEVAYLAGGYKWAVDAAIVALTQRGALEYDSTAKCFRQKAPLTSNAHSLETAVLREAQLESTGSSLRSLAKSGTEEVRRRLQERQLLISDQASWQVRLLPALILAAALTLGIVKIGIGIDRNKPVAFLVIMCIALIVCILISLFRNPARSRYGNAVLERLRKQRKAKTPIDPSKAADLDQNVVLGVALFGALALTGTEFTMIRRELSSTQVVNNSSGGSGCGGSSCGGGGCGGGGCGGCS